MYGIQFHDNFDSKVLFSDSKMSMAIDSMLFNITVMNI